MPRIKVPAMDDVELDDKIVEPANDHEQFAQLADEYAADMNPRAMDGLMNEAPEAAFAEQAMDPMMTPDFQIDQGHLVAPPPLTGNEQRWVRITANGDNDNRNWQIAMRQKWVPRDPRTVKDAEQFYPLSNDKSFIQSGDLVLCERPKQIGDVFRAQIEAKNRHQQGIGTLEAEKAGAAARDIEGFSGLQKQDNVTTTRGRGRPATMVG